jgi:hypothetical protein
MSPFNQRIMAMAFLSTLLLGVSGCGKVQPPEQIQVTELTNKLQPRINTFTLVESRKTNLRDLPQQRCNKGKLFKVETGWHDINLIKDKFPANCWSYRGEVSGIYAISSQ